MLDNDTFQRALSTADTYVLSNSHSKAKSSCDQPRVTLATRTL
jgi:hypothetical protein